MVVGVGSQSWASFHSCRGRPRIWWGSRGRRPRWGPPSCWRCRGWPEGGGHKWFINTTLPNSARNELSQSFHNLVHWLKTSAFTFKTLLRHYAKETPRSLNVKLGPRRNYHKGRAATRHYANPPPPVPDYCVADPISRWETVGSTAL